MRMGSVFIKVAALVGGALLIFACASLADVRNRYLLFGAPALTSSSGPFGLTLSMTPEQAAALLKQAGLLETKLRFQSGDHCQGLLASEHDVRVYFDRTWRRGSGCLVFINGRLATGGFGYEFGVI